MEILFKKKRNGVRRVRDFAFEFVAFCSMIEGWSKRRLPSIYHHDFYTYIYTNGKTFMSSFSTKLYCTLVFFLRLLREKCNTRIFFWLKNNIILAIFSVRKKHMQSLLFFCEREKLP